MIRTGQQQWREYLGGLDQQQLGASEERRAQIRDDLQTGQDVLEELVEGEAFVKEYYDTAVLQERRRDLEKRRKDLGDACVEFAKEHVTPFVVRATALLNKAEQMNDPASTISLTPLLAFALQFLASNRAAFVASAEALQRPAPIAPVAANPTPAPRAKPQVATTTPNKPRAPTPVATRPAKPAAPEVWSAPREPDDLSELGPDEVRVRVLTAGFSPSATRSQASASQVLKMPRDDAHRSAQAGCVEIIEERPS
jgi:hypothetical protein